MFTDFIGVFENVLTTEECQRFIDYFEQMKSLNLVYNRQDLKDAVAHKKDDETLFILENSMLPLVKQNPIMETFTKKFWPCYQEYCNEFSILQEVETHGIISARLQKTEPGGGYHMWHFESSSTVVATRIIAWGLYLNDIDLGGETEFLYQRRRFTPKAGRLVIWPAGFTHTHRGNPPLSNSKYLLTGWLEYMGKV